METDGYGYRHRYGYLKVCENVVNCKQKKSCIMFSIFRKVHSYIVEKEKKVMNDSSETQRTQEVGQNITVLSFSSHFSVHTWLPWTT